MSKPSPTEPHSFLSGSKTIKLFATVVSILAGVVTIIYSISRDPTASQHNSGDNNVMVGGNVGGDISIRQEDSPSYRVDIIGEKMIKPGEKVLVKLDAERRQHLSGMTCHWQVLGKEGAVLKQAPDNCQMELTLVSISEATDFSRVSIVVEATSSSGKRYSAVNELMIRPDPNSSQYIEQQQASLRENMTKMFDEAGDTVNSAQTDAMKFTDRLQQFQTDVRRNGLASKLEHRPDRVFECSPGGCKVDARELCDAQAAGLAFGPTPGERLFQTSLDCRDVEAGGASELCLTPPFDIIGLQPGAELYGDILFADAAPIPFNIKVSYNADSYDHQDPSWTPLRARGADAAKAPFAALKFEAYRRSFQLFLGASAAHCYGARPSLEIAYDSDGKGFINTSQGGQAQNVFPIVPPQGDAIKVRVSHNGESREFSYTFDLEQIIRQTAANLGRPQLNCQRNADVIGCALPDHDPLVIWANVQTIRYSASSDQLENSLPVSINGKQIFEKNPRNILSAYRFTVPGDWSDIFYQLEFKDGRLGNVERIPM